MKKHGFTLKFCLFMFVILVMFLGLIPGAFCSGTPTTATDPNESAIVDSRDFKQLTMTPGLQYLTVSVTFWAWPAFDEIKFYMNTNNNPPADMEIRCYPTSYEVRKSSTPDSGYFDILISTGSAVINRLGVYTFSVPWSSLGVSSFGVWIADTTSRDVLPDTGEIAMADPRIFGSDPNETSVVDNQDFKKLTILCGTTNLESMISFYAAPSFSEFFYYMNFDSIPCADICVRCHMTDFKVYTSSVPNSGAHDVLQYTGTPTISGSDYIMNIPWTYIPSSNFNVWLYNMDSLDRLKDSTDVQVVR